MRSRRSGRFLLIGALAFGLLHAGRGATGDAARTAPPAAAADALSGDEEALYRAALAYRLDRDDPVVQARLIRNMRFLTGSAAGGRELYRDAATLGMADGDLVVRRRLVDRMRRLLEAPALAAEPSEAELQAYLGGHPERFMLPARLRLTQVFLSRQRRGERVHADAARLLERLGTADVPRAAALGDPLPFPSELSAASPQDLARLLGPQFAAAAFALPPGRWQGPLASAYGAHLVWVREREEAHLAPLPSVRAQVRAAVREERAAAALREGLTALRPPGAP